MKTLDPTSVVRETEFETAAKSAGVWEQFKNIPLKKLEGKILTPTQREAFKKLSKVYIENKGRTYDRLFNDFQRVIDNN